MWASLHASLSRLCRSNVSPDLLALVSGLLLICLTTVAESAKIVPGYTCVMTATGFSRAAGIVQYASSTLFDFGIFFITAGRLYRLCTWSVHFSKHIRSLLTFTRCLRTYEACQDYPRGLCLVFHDTRMVSWLSQIAVISANSFFRLSLAGLLLFACLPPARATLSAVIANLARSISVIITSRIVLRLREFVANPEATVTVGTMTCPPVISSRFSEASSDGSTTVYTKGSTSKEWNPRGRGQAPILAKAVTEDVEMPTYSPYQRAF